MDSTVLVCVILSNCVLPCFPSNCETSVKPIVGLLSTTVCNVVACTKQKLFSARKSPMYYGNES